MFIRCQFLESRTLHRHTAGSRASTKFLHRPARSLRRTISLLSPFGAVAGVQLQTSRSIKPRERDLGDLRLFVLARFFTRPTNHPRHAACASNNKSKPVRPQISLLLCDESTWNATNHAHDYARLRSMESGKAIAMSSRQR